MRSFLAATLLAGAAFFSGCAFHERALVLEPVGPSSPQTAAAGLKGKLVVYSALDRSGEFNDYPYLRQYTDYKLLSEQGNLLQIVHNNQGSRVETPWEVEFPAQVELPPGKYYVIARANGRKTVTLPVVIAAGQLTTVHLEGNASREKVSALAPIEPVPWPSDAAKPSGYLKVYSATEAHDTGDDTYYYPHTDYVIYDAGGKMFKYVRNHVGTMDENPALVRLPSGEYKVAAQDNGYGRIRVPVVVKPGKTTILHLDRAWEPPANVAKSELIRLPDGEYVGWRAHSDEQTQSSKLVSKGN